MADTNTPKGDRVGNDYQEGNNPAPGGEIDTGDSVVPPYDDRNRSRNERADGPARMLNGEEPPKETIQPGGDKPVRPDAEMAPDNVGESIGTRGEDIGDRDGKERGRHDEGTDKGGRPVGTSDESDRTGI